MKIAKKVINLLMVFVLMSMIVFGNAPSNADEQIITFNKLYADGETTVMPVYILYDGKVSGTLTDEKGKVLVNYTTVDVKAQNTLYYKKSFKSLVSGTYYLNIKYFYASPYGLEDTVENRSLKITHKQAVTTITCSQTYQEYNAEGVLIQKIKFPYENALGKTIYIEIYDSVGNMVYELSFIAKYVNGNYTLAWDYYPYYGGLRVSNGDYIVKYWVDGYSAKQTKFTVKI